MIMEDGMTQKTPTNLILPSNLPKQKKHEFHLEELHEGSEMYAGIVTDLKKSGFKVEKIERLENFRLMKRYITERDQLDEDRCSLDPTYKLNEKYLYHGTSAKKQQICDEGLDSRMAKQGCFGRGIYFSDYPRKCLKYAERESTKKPIILLVRVILGTAKFAVSCKKKGRFKNNNNFLSLEVYPKGAKDKSLVREPEKTEPYEGYKFFDSVEGCPVNHREFVVYESRRALVECIVTYSKLPDIQIRVPQHFLNSFPQRPAKLVFEDSDDSSDEDDDADYSGGAKPKRSSGNNLRLKHDSSDDSSSDDDNPSGSQATASRVRRQDKDPNSDMLQELERQFAAKTGETDKHLIETYLHMTDLDLNAAVALHEQNIQKEREWTKEDLDAPQKLISSSNDLRINPERLKYMSSADRDQAVSCLIDNLLEAMGRDVKDEEERRLATQYLRRTEMDLDEAMCLFIQDMSCR